MIERFSLDDDIPLDLTARQPLHIELVPTTSWGDNLRSRLSKADWDRVRKHTYRRANYRCEICGGAGFQQGYNWPVECHEVWGYDDDQHVQTLVRLIALCPRCHLVKHIGRAQQVGKFDEAMGQLRAVNGWDVDSAKAHIREAFRVWQERSRHQWTLDLAFLDECGVQVNGG